MVGLSDALQNLFLLVFGIIWFGVGVALYLRFKAKENAFMRHFEREFDFWIGDPFFIPSRQSFLAIARLVRQQQSDPAVERLRREVWRRNRYVMVWVLGFPLLVFGVLALLIINGFVH